mmetsp:Transcript_27005/g.62699  ORF Transcript_27005/g.62699 Transcript_27005/m.62699 type:complete len:202 (+) Transcript_27005:322-927(+)
MSRLHQARLTVCVLHHQHFTARHLHHATKNLHEAMLSREVRAGPSAPVGPRNGVLAPMLCDYAERLSVPRNGCKVSDSDVLEVVCGHVGGDVYKFLAACCEYHLERLCTTGISCHHSRRSSSQQVILSRNKQHLHPARSHHQQLQCLCLTIPPRYETGCPPQVVDRHDQLPPPFLCHQLDNVGVARLCSEEQGVFAFVVQI